MFEWLTVSPLQFVMFGVVKKCLHKFCLTKIWVMMEIVDKSDCQIIWYLFAGLKPMSLCSVHSI